MKVFKSNSMIKGWFVGDFEPTALKTKDCEVAYKSYKEGEFEARHMHKIATEVTFIAEGRVMMNNTEFNPGDIIILEPGEATDFKAITASKNIVVKVPCVKGDKYLLD